MGKKTKDAIVDGVHDANKKKAKARKKKKKKSRHGSG